MGTSDLSGTYRDVNTLLQLRYRDYPKRLEPTWSSLVSKLEMVSEILSRRVRCISLGPPSETAYQGCSKIVDFPVFVVGYYKTGTSLVLSLLDDHCQLSVLPAESSHFSIFLPKYGTLPRYLQEDILLKRWVHKLINPSGKPPFWTLGRPEETSSDPYEQFANYLYWFAGQYSDRDLLAALAVAYYAVRVDRGIVKARARMWVEKTPNNEFHLDEITQTYPKARFLHIVRDPRSIVASIKRVNAARGTTDFHVVNTSRRIAQSFRLAHDNLERIGSDKYLVLRYEDLVANPKPVMRRVAQFLEIDFSVSLFEPTTAGQPMISNSAWASGRVAGQIHKLSLHRWSQELDSGSLNLVLALTASAARSHGYLLPNVGAARRFVTFASYAARRVVLHARQLGPARLLPWLGGRLLSKIASLVQ